MAERVVFWAWLLPCMVLNLPDSPLSTHLGLLNATEDKSPMMKELLLGNPTPFYYF